MCWSMYYLAFYYSVIIFCLQKVIRCTTTHPLCPFTPLGSGISSDTDGHTGLGLCLVTHPLEKYSWTTYYKNSEMLQNLKPLLFLVSPVSFLFSFLFFLSSSSSFLLSFYIHTCFFRHYVASFF